MLFTSGLRVDFTCGWLAGCLSRKWHLFPPIQHIHLANKKAKPRIVVILLIVQQYNRPGQRYLICINFIVRGVCVCVPVCVCMWRKMDPKAAPLQHKTCECKNIFLSRPLRALFYDWIIGIFRGTCRFFLLLPWRHFVRQKWDYLSRRGTPNFMYRYMSVLVQYKKVLYPNDSLSLFPRREP